jgi:hypothetical protein
MQGIVIPLFVFLITGQGAGIFFALHVVKRELRRII